MRFSKDKATLIKNEIKKCRPNAKVYLFGSRTDDSKRGGDIDILILDDNKLSIAESSKIEIAFWIAFGEQKIDLVCFPSDSDHPFKRLAMLKAIAL